MSALLYLLTAPTLLLGIRRALGLRTSSLFVLFSLPLTFAGLAMFQRSVIGPVDLAFATMPLSSVAESVGIHYSTNPELSDVYTEFYPWNAALRDSIRHWQWPLWNPFELCGTPLAATVQSSPYHPITLLALLLLQPDGITFTVAMVLLFAALSAFLFLRDLEISDGAALVGAAAWMLSSHTIFYLGTALVLAAATLPLALFGARRVARHPGLPSGVILTIALLLNVLAGHPESTLHVVTLAVCVFLIEAAAIRFRDRAAILRTGLSAGFGALLLSAVFLLPMFDAIEQTEEYRHRKADAAFVKPVATTRTLFHHLRANLLPYDDGRPGLEGRWHDTEVRHGWMPTSYVGTLAIGLALYGVWRAAEKRKWLFLGMVVWGLASGANAPGFAHLMQRLPVFDIAVNDRMISFAAFGICVLAAMGLDAALLRGEMKALALVLGASSLLFLALGAERWPKLMVADLAPEFVYTAIVRQVLPLVLAALAVWWLRSPRMVVATVLLLLAGQRIGETRDLQPVVPRRAFYPPFPGLEKMRHSEPFRIAAFGDLFTPATSTLYGLEDVRGFQAMTFGRLFETFPFWSVHLPLWSNRIDDLGAPMLSLMNVRFALTHPRPIPPGWKLVARMPRYDILENTQALPRAFVPAAIHYVGEGGGLAAVGAARDFSAEAWIEREGSSETQPNGPGNVRSSKQGSNLRLEVTMHGAGWVVISQSAWRGWHARSGGKELPLRIANHAFLAVYLPAGRHLVELNYLPKSFLLGAATSAITAMLILMWWIRRVMLSRRRSSAARPQDGEGSLSTGGAGGGVRA